MKKVSTTAAMQGSNISQQRLTIGLDLGDRNRWYCVQDEVGQTVAQPLPNNRGSSRLETKKQLKIKIVPGSEKTKAQAEFR